MITLVREEGLLPDSQAGRSIGYRQALEYLSSVWGFSGDKETRGTYTTKVYSAPSSLSCIEEIFLSVYGTLPATFRYRPVSVWYPACNCPVQACQCTVPCLQLSGTGLSVYGTLPATVRYGPVSVWYPACNCLVQACQCMVPCLQLSGTGLSVYSTLPATVWYRPVSVWYLACNCLVHLSVYGTLPECNCLVQALSALFRYKEKNCISLFLSFSQFTKQEHGEPYHHPLPGGDAVLF